MKTILKAILVASLVLLAAISVASAGGYLSGGVYYYPLQYGSWYGNGYYNQAIGWAYAANGAWYQGYSAPSWW